MGTNSSSLTTAHFIWIGEDFKLPSLYQKCLQTFYRLHIGWSIKIWRWKELKEIVSSSKYNFEKYNTFINRYNYLKYHILAKYGGWYVDFDIIWKKSLDELIRDKTQNKKIPQLFIPVRSFPNENNPSLIKNDDMLLFSEPNLFWELLDVCFTRQDVSFDKKYEPIGPVSLSKWLHSASYSRIYMFENEIQENGYYCNHLNNKSWIIN